MYSRSFPDRSQMPKNYSGTMYPPQKEPPPPPAVPQKDSGAIKLNTEDLLLIGIALLLMSSDGETDLILLLALLFATGMF